jgi:hypothetical protein
MGEVRLGLSVHVHPVLCIGFLRSSSGVRSIGNRRMTEFRKNLFCNETAMSGGPGGQEGQVDDATEVFVAHQQCSGNRAASADVAGSVVSRTRPSRTRARHSS